MAKVMVFSGHPMKVTESELRCQVMALIDQSYSGFPLYDGTASITRLKKTLPISNSEFQITPSGKQSSQLDERLYVNSSALQTLIDDFRVMCFHALVKLVAGDRMVGLIEGKCSK
tara:strand:- start:344 stop:688 length:345 start_codon:yes stop_codon:yes gene_type:complete